jgi:hypothetical protein
LSLRLESIKVANEEEEMEKLSNKTNNNENDKDRDRDKENNFIKTTFISSNKDKNTSSNNTISEDNSPALKFRIVKPKKVTKIRIINPVAGVDLPMTRDVNLNLNLNMNFNIMNPNADINSPQSKSNSKTLNLSSPKLLTQESPIKSKHNFIYDNSNFKKCDLGVNARTGNTHSGKIVSFGVNTHNGNIR